MPPHVALLAAPQEDILPLVITSALRSPVRVLWWDPRISPSQLKKGLIPADPSGERVEKGHFSQPQEPTTTNPSQATTRTPRGTWYPRRRTCSGTPGNLENRQQS